jgi:hypothetical protein
MMDAPHHEGRADRRGSRRFRRAPAEGARRGPAISLTPEGLPAMTPHAPPPSPVVVVSEEGRGRYPWLPARVIAGSVWSGPRQVRVQVDRSGNVAAWPRRPATSP